jgi:hypothetical protein
VRVQELLQHHVAVGDERPARACAREGSGVGGWGLGVGGMRLRETCARADGLGVKGCDRAIQVAGHRAIHSCHDRAKHAVLQGARCLDLCVQGRRGLLGS